jgi:hypothetical protein
MALSYHRINEEEDQMRNVFEKGGYAFQVKSIESKKTKSGNNLMLVVELSVHDSKFARTINVKDWIVLDMEEMAWKLRHFAATCGLLEKYDAEELDAKDFLGKYGVVKLSIREYEQDGELRKANAVADYIKPGKENLKEATPSNDFVDDDIPNM